MRDVLDYCELSYRDDYDDRMMALAYLGAMDRVYRPVIAERIRRKIKSELAAGR